MNLADSSPTAARGCPLRRYPAALPHRILVAEDDPCIRFLNTRALVHSGYRVSAAEDGELAWQALNTERYDLLITDNQMPRLSGVELLKKVRAARMALPVLMATGRWPEEEFAKDPELRPVGGLLKPYTIAALLETVKHLLRDTQPDRPQDPLPGP